MSARAAGQAEGRKLAALFLELEPRERLVRMRDRAAEHKDANAYYLGMLEGLVSAIGPAPEAPTVRRQNPAPSYEVFHWGLPVDQKIRAMAPTLKAGEELQGVGELVAVAYYTEKGDEGPGVYEHKFKRPRPLLSYKQNGFLIITGGGYRITPRGIVG